MKCNLLLHQKASLKLIVSYFINRFACPGPCYRVFSYKNNLFRHQRKSHPEIQRPPKIKLQIADKSPIRPHQCQICKKYYETTTLLNNHELVRKKIILNFNVFLNRCFFQIYLECTQQETVL